MCPKLILKIGIYDYRNKSGDKGGTSPARNASSKLNVAFNLSFNT